MTEPYVIEVWRGRYLHALAEATTFRAAIVAAQTLYDEEVEYAARIPRSRRHGRPLAVTVTRAYPEDTRTWTWKGVRPV